MSRCRECKYWRKHPELEWGFCEVPDAKFGGIGLIEATTAPDFGCVQFESKMPAKEFKCNHCGEVIDDGNPMCSKMRRVLLENMETMNG